MSTPQDDTALIAMLEKRSHETLLSVSALRRLCALARRSLEPTTEVGAGLAGFLEGCANDYEDRGAKELAATLRKGALDVQALRARPLEPTPTHEERQFPDCDTLDARDDAAFLRYVAGEIDTDEPWPHWKNLRNRLGVIARSLEGTATPTLDMSEEEANTISADRFPLLRAAMALGERGLPAFAGFLSAHHFLNTATPSLVECVREWQTAGRLNTGSPHSQRCVNEACEKLAGFDLTALGAGVSRDTPDGMLAAAQKGKWAIAPQCNGGWVICETHSVDISGDAPEGRELARTRGTLQEALGMALARVSEEDEHGR